MKACVVIPVFNHASTLLGVALSARRHAPVIVVDDGSTDGARALLEAETTIESIFEPVNRGKGRALEHGFGRARERGYTHAITLDADGQHDPDQIPDFLAQIALHPESIIVGSRDLRRASAPAPRRFANAFSSFWHWVQTGRRLPDTQCGFRAYPLGPIVRLHPGADRYGFELEMLVHAAWLGIETRAAPIRVDYGAPDSQRSHFRPVVDFARIGMLNAKLTFQALALPPALRRAIVERGEPDVSLTVRIGRRLSAFGARTRESPSRVGVAVALGVGVGLLPLWGLQGPLHGGLTNAARLCPTTVLAGFDLTRPLAAVVPMALAALAGPTRALDFLLPQTGAIGQSLIAWFALYLVSVSLAGVLAWALAERVSRKTGES